MVAGRDLCTVVDVAYKSLSLETQCDSKKIGCQLGEEDPIALVDNCPIPRPSESQLDLKSRSLIPKPSVENGKMQFVPIIRSGSCSDIGHKLFMEDEHLRIDDLSKHLGPVFKGPTPNAFYGVFDGHDGDGAAVFIRNNLLKFVVKDADFLQSMKKDVDLPIAVEKAVRNVFLEADLALADDCDAASSSGTTVLTALILGRYLLVANAGDCRAVLCRRGKAIEMSMDHKPNCISERSRIEASGGFVVDGYLNGELAVARALGHWDMKMPKGSISPLSAEPEFRHTVLSEEDEFLIIGCDGIWDVMSNQCAVSIAREELMQHNDPEQCSKKLVQEALNLDARDNLTVVIVCFSADPPPRIERPRLRFCSISAEGFRNLRGFLREA